MSSQKVIFHIDNWGEFFRSIYNQILNAHLLYPNKGFNVKKSSFFFFRKEGVSDIYK